MRRRAGLTLIEAMMTMALILVLLGLISGISSGYGNMFRFSASKDQTLQAAQMGLDTIRTELCQATRVLEPPGASPGSWIKFEKVNPGVARLPLSPQPASWNPTNPAFLVTVEYRVVDETLIRETVQPGATSRQVIASGVKGLGVQLQSDGSYRISLQVEEQRRPVTLVTAALSWVR